MEEEEEFANRIVNNNFVVLYICTLGFKVCGVVKDYCCLKVYVAHLDALVAKEVMYCFSGNLCSIESVVSCCIIMGCERKNYEP